MTAIGRALASPSWQRRLWGAGAAPLGQLAQAATEWHGIVPLWLDRPLTIAPELGTELDYQQFAELVEEVSGWLAGAGVSFGDTVAIVKAHNIDVIALAEATARLGAVPALIAPEFDPDVIRVLLGRLGHPVVVADRPAITRHGLRSGYTSTVVCADGNVPGMLCVDDVRGHTPPAPRPRRRDETVAVTHTSGTTGVPKLIRHTGETLAGQAAVQVLGGRLLLGAHDVVATCLTTAHARTLSGLPTIAAVGAPHLALVDPDPASAAQHLVRRQPTVVETFPNVFLRWEELADHPGMPFARVRVFLSTFDAAHPRSIRRLLGASQRRCPLYAQAYAQSEVGAIAVGFRTRRGASRGDARNVGWPTVALTRVRIVDDDGRRVRQPGRIGRIQAHGPGMFAGYVGEDARTAAQRYGRWWDTGDRGARRPTGQIRLAGRQVDALPGVDNPLAVEDVLLDRLPELIEVVLIAGRDGQPTPVVCTGTGEPVDPDRWAAAVRDQPPLDPPQQWRWEDLPKTATWKIRRQTLAARSATASGEAEGDGCGEGRHGERCGDAAAGGRAASFGS